VVVTIGDGSFQYSVQAIWTAAQHRLPIVFVVMRNGEYSILKAFALLEKPPACPAWTYPASTSPPSQQASAAEQSTSTPPKNSPTSSPAPSTPTDPPSSSSQPNPKMAHLG
jgi:benzoylformate decarboxylase